MWKALGPAEAKSPIDFCTEADHAVERLIRDRSPRASATPMIGEEDGGEAGENVWVVDPIDGTTGYIHGDGRWCVSLAYVRADRIEARRHLRALERAAVRGATGRRRPPERTASTRSSISRTARRRWSSSAGRTADRSRPIATCCSISARDGIEFRRHGSGALALADVALGVCDGYIELHINAWDALAGILLVQEAGGRTNDFLADGGLTRGNLLIATTPELHDRVHRIVENGRAVQPAANLAAQ